MGEAVGDGPPMDALDQKLGRDIEQEIHDTTKRCITGAWTSWTRTYIHVVRGDAAAVKLDFDDFHLDLDVYAPKTRAASSRGRGTGDGTDPEALCSSWREKCQRLEGGQSPCTLSLRKERISLPLSQKKTCFFFLGLRNHAHIRDTCRSRAVNK
jgi:hypothetical protein